MEDPLQYIKDIQSLTWRDLGYDQNMNRVLLGSNSRFINGVDADAYYEEGGFQGAQLQSISANKIITSILRAVVNVGDSGAQDSIEIDGPNKRILFTNDGIPSILIGNPD